MELRDPRILFLPPFKMNSIIEEECPSQFCISPNLECKSQIYDFNMSNYIPLSHFVDLNYLRTSTRTETKVCNSSTYFGELYNQKKNGMGILIYKNGRIFEGFWMNDLKHGNGFEFYNNGNTYMGEYSEGKPHGQGIFKWKSGEIYEGQFNKGLKSGEGKWFGIRNEMYSGHWENNKPHGYGIMVFSNKDVYKGEWKEGLKCGFGVTNFAKGSIHNGYYYDWKPNGYGKYIQEKGETYEGKFMFGKMNGFGKWMQSKEKESNLYIGIFNDNKKDGFGFFRWRNGNSYMGQFVDNEREGIGEMVWNDGSRYIGEWKRGERFGYGKMFCSDGTHNEGEFCEDIFIGSMNYLEIPSFFKKNWFNNLDNFDIKAIAPDKFDFSEIMVIKSKHKFEKNKLGNFNFTHCLERNNFKNKEINAVRKNNLNKLNRSLLKQKSLLFEKVYQKEHNKHDKSKTSTNDYEPTQIMKRFP